MTRTERQIEKTRQRCAKYGITLEQYELMLEAQGQSCAICLSEFDGTPHIDHDHVTQQVRGLLCMSCNVSIGRMKDDAEALRRAAKYLEG